MSDVDANLSTQDQTGLGILTKSKQEESEPGFKKAVYATGWAHSYDDSIYEFAGADVTHCQQFGAGDEFGCGFNRLGCHSSGP